MKNQLKIFMVVGLLALMLPLLFMALSPVNASHSATVFDHANSTDITDATCGGCHDPNEIDPNNATYSGAHRRHLASAFLNFATNTPGSSKGCGKCHDESVFGGGVNTGMGSGYEGDLSYALAETTDTTATGASRTANKHVKAGACETCHGQFQSSLTGHTGVTASDSCATTTCHADAGTGGDAEDEHEFVTYITAGFANSPTYCVRCHGELAWYQTEETKGTTATPLPLP